MMFPLDAVRLLAASLPRSQDPSLPGDQISPRQIRSPRVPETDLLAFVCFFVCMNFMTTAVSFVRSLASYLFRPQG